SPLGVGLLSRGEYFDMEVNSVIPSNQAVKAFNDVMVEGVEVLSYRLLPDDAKNGMSIIAAADYMVHFDDNYISQDDIDSFIAQDEINVIKKTKKSEKEVDIKPLILDIKSMGNDIFMKVIAGSAENLKPELVIENLFKFVSKDMPSYVSERLEMYANADGSYISLEDLGNDVI
ncbi:MAG: TIGR03936 family radical SAM-associated protein, partial [Lachnospiraceae bacterium]|nr:TIGR03936 family radical SAM-associated protein [Lachnospiraceae bacterium]